MGRILRVVVGVNPGKLHLKKTLIKKWKHISPQELEVDTFSTSRSPRAVKFQNRIFLRSALTPNTITLLAQAMQLFFCHFSSQSLKSLSQYEAAG